MFSGATEVFEVERGCKMSKKECFVDKRSQSQCIFIPCLFPPYPIQSSKLEVKLSVSVCACTASSKVACGRALCSA